METEARLDPELLASKASPLGMPIGWSPLPKGLAISMKEDARMLSRQLPEISNLNLSEFWRWTWVWINQEAPRYTDAF